MIWIVLTFTFVIVSVMPGDPIQAKYQDLLASGVSPEEAAAQTQALARFRPDGTILEQYLDYLGSLLRLDFGQSLYSRVDVSTILADAAKWTVIPGLLGTLLSFGLHYRWKRITASYVPAIEHGTALDVGAGTADLALLIEPRMGTHGRVIASDLNHAMLAEELTPFGLRIDDPDFFRAGSEIRLQFLIQLLARIRWRHHLDAHLQRAAVRRFKPMRTHECSARPRHIGHEHAGWSQDRHFDERLPSELLQRGRYVDVQSAVVAARRTHEHATPDVELYLAGDVRVARVIAKSAIPYRQVFPGKRCFDQFLLFNHGDHFTPRFSKTNAHCDDRLTRG